MRAAAVALGLLLPALPAAADNHEPTGALLQGLDKITARIFAIEAPFEQPVRFGHLEIVAHACVVNDEGEAPERTAFLEIAEIKPGRASVNVFSGWMFASSPSVSAMEHPVYDVWVVDCGGLQTEEAAPVAAKPTEDDVAAPTDDAERPLD